MAKKLNPEIEEPQVEEAQVVEDIDSGNVRLKAAPTSSDSTVFKIFRTVMNS